MYQNRHGTTTAVRPATGPQVQQSYTVKHDFESAASVTATLTHALSDVAGIDATEAEFALAEYADPEALDRIFAPVTDGSPRTSGHISFNVRGYETTVYANGLISIVPPQTPQHR